MLAATAYAIVPTHNKAGSTASCPGGTRVEPTPMTTRMASKPIGAKTALNSAQSDVGKIVKSELRKLFEV